MAQYYDKYIKHGALHWKYYEQRHGLYYPIVEAVVEKVPRNVSVLDLGCGDGIMDHLLALRGCKVLGFDIDETGIKLAREKTSNCTYPYKPIFKIEDITDIKAYGNIHYDVGLSIDVVEHLDKPMILLENMFTVCSSVIVGTLERSRNKPEKYHVKEYTKDELICMIMDVGFKNVVVSEIPLRHKKKYKNYLLAVGRM